MGQICNCLDCTLVGSWHTWRTTMATSEVWTCLLRPMTGAWTLMDSTR